MMEVVITQASHPQFSSNPREKRNTLPKDFRIGEKGRVMELHSDSVTVDVVLDTGIYLKYVPVRSMEWVLYGEDTEKEYNAGERDLPPLHSRVFILMPSGTYDDCFVLCSLFSTPDKGKPFLDENREKIKEGITPSGWHITNDNDTGSHKAVSRDKKTSIEIDYGSIDKPLDPPELHAQLFHDPEKEDPGIKLDVVSGKTVDMSVFKDVTLHHEKEKQVVVTAFDTEVTIEKSKLFIAHKGHTKVTTTDLDIISDKPIGFVGTGTQLGEGVLRPYWNNMMKAEGRNPLWIAPVKFPKYVPVPPIPILQNMAIFGFLQDMIAASMTAIADSKKVLK